MYNQAIKDLIEKLEEALQRYPEPQEIKIILDQLKAYLAEAEAEQYRDEELKASEILEIVRILLTMIGVAEKFLHK